MYTKKGERAHAHVCACVCVLHEKSKQGRRDNKRMQPTRHTQSQTEVKDRGKQPDDTATVTRNAREELGRQIERGGGNHVRIGNRALGYKCKAARAGRICAWEHCSISTC